MAPDEGITPRKIATSIITATLAIALLLVLVLKSGITWSDFRSIFQSTSAMDAGLAIVGVTVPVWLGAIKWRLVVERLRPGTLPGYHFFVYFTALAIMLGQIVTQFVSGPLVRGMALRRLEHDGFRLGLASSGFEQAFDAYVTLVFALAAIILAVSGVSTPLVLIGMAAFSLPAALLPAVIVRNAPRFTAHSRNMPKLGWVFGKVSRVAEAAARADLFDPSLLSRLYWISVARFWVLVLLAIAVAHMTSGKWEPAMIAHAFAIVQIVRFIAVTPGNLGVEEWGWAAVLLGFGWTLEAAALFSMSMRLMGFAIMVPVFLFSLVWHSVNDGRAKNSNGKTG